MTSHPGSAPDPVDLIALGEPVDGLPTWRPLPGHTVVSDQAGTVLPLLLPLPAGGRRLRVRVREIEQLRGTGDATIPPELKERTAFVDAVVIPAVWHG